MSEHSHEYSEIERANLAKQVVNAAKFIIAGAEYTKTGRLDLSDDSLEVLFTKEALRDFKKTGDFATIQEHKDNIRGVLGPLGVYYLDHEGIIFQSEGEAEEKIAAGFSYLSANNLDIDSTEMKPDSEKAKKAFATLNSAYRALDATIAPLARRTDLRIGSQVNVPLSPYGSSSEQIVEGGWVIIDIDANANFTLIHPEKKREQLMHVPITQIMDTNPVPLNAQYPPL